ncbi:MAG TPA: hypothetical protein VFF33_10030 [Ignavibacteriaceae bacterium]|nr:hypothetical protein [Ignavibacteriaceae bacterium]
MKYLLGFILLFISGCDIFDTRDAETPEQGRANFQTAFNPEDVINNLINSLKDRNLENYLACFSDSSYTSKIFIFDFAPGTAFVFETTWTKKQEEQYFNNLKNKIEENQQITLILNNASFSSPSGDSIFYTASYVLNVPHIDNNIPKNYEGELKFNLIRDDRSIWSIYYWQDIKTDNKSSWSDLKGWFY